MRNYFLYSILFILFSALLYALFIKPWYVTARAKYDHINDLREAFMQGERLQATRDKLQSGYNSIFEDKRNLVENAVPEHSPKNVVLLLLALDELIKVSGLPLDTSYSVGTERKDSEVVVLPISFSFGGISYDLLRRFVENLQRWERGVRIRSVQIGLPVDSDSVQQGFVRATIVIEALFSSA